MKKFCTAVSYAKYVLVLALALIPCSASGQATMQDYCVTPPLIGTPITPNLLMMFDNSASMYDLNYVDKGKPGTCSTTTTRTCYKNADCPAPQTCQGSPREPAYCYDQTYRNSETYTGYFNSHLYYQYDFVNEHFTLIGTSLPASMGGVSCTGTNSATLRAIPNTLCITGTNLNVPTTTGKTITGFAAKGNYLNWLTASKFDIQKQILTGGKYGDKVCSNDTNRFCTGNADCPSGGSCTATAPALMNESRGCVGRSFVKEALTADYVEGGTNTSLLITFGVRGPTDPYNPSAPSPGGQTYIDIYAGADYRQDLCQAAVAAFADPSCNHSCQRDKAAACLASLVGADTTLETKQKVVFQQTVQECWQYNSVSPKTVGNDAVNTVKNQCPDLLMRCQNDLNRYCDDSNQSKRDQSCGVSNAVCVRASPSIITPGDPALLCSSSYAGFCYNNTTNTWIANGYTSADACIIAKHNEFCGSFEQPTVIDPTDDPSVTETYDNLPALLSDIGVQGQLDKPVRTLRVRLRMDAAPTGLVHDFRDLIRFGAMTFNFNGSAAECASGLLPCPKVCSTDPSITCGSKRDCPSPETATCSTTTNNFDGAQIIHDIGAGTCYHTDAATGQPTTQITPVVKCTTDANCAAGKKCVSDGVGNYASGFVKAINNIRASTWTPFAEAFYNAIGYMATDRRCSNSSATRCSKDSDCPTGGTCPPSTGRSRTDLRLSSSETTETAQRRDFDERYNPSQYLCQKNNILLISDGMSTADQRSSVSSLAALYAPAAVRTPEPAGVTGTCSKYAGSQNLDDLAWIAKNRNINTFSTSSASPAPTAPRHNDSITTYVVFTGTRNNEAGDCDSETLLTKTAVSGGSKTLKKAETPEQLKEQIRNALWEIAAGAVSGTAASVLASGEGSGANLIQAVFFPTKKFINSTSSTTATFDEIMWTGRLTNLWYYVDPHLQQSSIREDDGNKILDLKTSMASKDYVVKMYFDALTETARATRWPDADGDGAPENPPLSPDIPIEAISNLWEAGTLLWQRDAADRTIYTTTGGTSLTAFTTANAATLAPLLNVSPAEAQNIITWVRGGDIKTCSNATSTICTTDTNCTPPGTCGYYRYRSRTVKVDLNNDGDTLDAGETTARVWKLGDILNSTPRISSWLPLNTYHKVYGDGTYGVPYQNSSLSDPPDASRYTTTSAYKNRDMVYVGGNDGMLHAFKLGRLELKWDNQTKTEKARLTGTDLGKEMWAFIPRNALPYLRYLSETGYCHLYSVDLTPYIFDASIGDPAAGDVSALTRAAGHWRTILIGGMRYGGACRNRTATCTDVDGDSQKDCVNTPVDNLGYSSYFALDITDQNNPRLLWEFSHEDLGFSTAGPAVLRMKARDAAGNELPAANGKWFVVLASGPTGPINTNDRQFMGRSDQNLRLFVLDLKSGTLLRAIDTGIALAFAGNVTGGVFDEDLDYQDDVVYIPYVRKASAGNTWTSGGVVRLVTKDAFNAESVNPADWTVSRVMDGVGPVTASVRKLYNSETSTLWLFFGTGRYFFEQSGGVDDGAGQRHLIGMKEPCFSATGIDRSCTTTRTLGDLVDVTDANNVVSNPAAANYYGWYITLDRAGMATHPPEKQRAYHAERLVTDPSAGGAGVVFFTTYKPYDDECELTGRTFIWGLKYDTGGSAAALLAGTLVIQLSKGQIVQVNLKDAFTEKQGRRGDVGPGAPPGPGGGIVAPRSAVNRTVHIKER